MLSNQIIKDNLDIFLNNCDNVFILPHNRPDMDALASSLAMNLICEKEGIKSYIVIDEETGIIESATKSVISDVYKEVNIIKKSEISKYKTDNTSLIVLDTNKKNMICLSKELNDYKDIFVIDHHKTDDNTIKTNYLFVDYTMSSTSEIMCSLLSCYKVTPNPRYANYLLSGIILDTNRFSKNVSSNTYQTASTLLSYGADVKEANDIFLEDFEKDRKVQELINNTIFFNGFAIASDENIIYDPEELAKAADYLLKYRIIACFAISKISNDFVGVSARSKGLIDVCKIVNLLGDGGSEISAGGSEVSAAVKIKNTSVFEVVDRLKEILNQNNNLDNEPKLTLKK